MIKQNALYAYKYKSIYIWYIYIYTLYNGIYAVAMDVLSSMAFDSPGTRIRLVEVVLLEEENRLRARLVEPDGWITLKNLETGRLIIGDLEPEKCPHWKKETEPDKKKKEAMQLCCSDHVNFQGCNLGIPDGFWKIISN